MLISETKTYDEYIDAIEAYGPVFLEAFERIEDKYCLKSIVINGRQLFSFNSREKILEKLTDTDIHASTALNHLLFAEFSPSESRIYLEAALDEAALMKISLMEKVN